MGMQPELRLDDVDLDRFLPIATAFGTERYGYAVTPNVDHLIRLHEDPRLRAAYAAATFTLLDSRVLALALRMTRGLQPRVCTGSDLTERLLLKVIGPDDAVILVGGRADQAQAIARRFGLRNLRHHNPPMDFIRDPAAVEECLSFVERQGAFRFCFLAVGSPQQEIIAQRLGERGVARGLVLCVGAAVNFLTGVERRAPRWMQQASLEWLYRLLGNPRRLAHRYLVRGPAALRLLPETGIVLRRHTAS
jgi:exopolysaccharide biosynthesis WecB/TagA/CpsF family protein